MNTEVCKEKNWYIIILGGAMFLYIACHIIISLNKGPSLDELYTYYEFKGKSINEFYPSKYATLNLMPQGYFLMLNLLDNVVDLGIIGMRIPNLILSIVGMLLFYYVLRSQFDKTVASVATCIVFCHFTTMLYQIAEARPYMMFFVLSISQVLLILRRLKSKSKYLIWANLLISFLLPFSFYFGGIYSFICLITVITFGILRKKSDISFIFSFIIGWAVFFACCWQVLQGHHQGRSEMFWNSSLEFLRFWDLHNLYASFITFPYAVLPSLVLLGAFLRKTTRRHKEQVVQNDASEYLSAIMAGWIFLPTFIFILCEINILHTFEIRFFIPTCMAFGWLIACILENYFKYISSCDIYIRKLSHIRPIKFAVIILTIGSFADCIYFAGSYFRTLEYSDIPETEISKIKHPILTYNHNLFFHHSFSNQNQNVQSYLILENNQSQAFFRLYSSKLKTLSLDSNWDNLENFCFVFNESRIDLNSIIEKFNDKGFQVKSSMSINLPFTPNVLTLSKDRNYN